MAINGSPRNTVTTQVTSQTTTEGSFRTGMTDVIAQVDTTEILLNAPGLTNADFIKLAAINSSASAIDNIAATTATTAEINRIADGVTASASDINVFTNNTLTTQDIDFIEALNTPTLTAGDVNKLADVTASGAAIQNVAATTSSTADLNVIDGASGVGLSLTDLRRAQALDAAGNGSNGQLLTTNGATPAVYSWTTPAGNSFIVEDGDNTEVRINPNSEIKFNEGTGINIDFTDTTPGSDADPFDLTFNIVNNSINATLLNVSGNGTTSQWLRSDGDGSFTWATPPNTTYSLFSRTAQGLVPNPGGSGSVRFLREDGSWITPTNTTYSAGQGIGLSGTTFSVAAGSGLTQSATGLAHSDTSSQGSSNNSGRTVIQDITVDGFGHITGLGTTTLADTNTTYPSQTQAVWDAGTSTTESIISPSKLSATIDNIAVIEPESAGDPVASDFVNGAIFVVQYA